MDSAAKLLAIVLEKLEVLDVHDGGQQLLVLSDPTLDAKILDAIREYRHERLGSLPKLRID